MGRRRRLLSQLRERGRGARSGGPDEDGLAERDFDVAHGRVLGDVERVLDNKPTQRKRGPGSFRALTKRTGPMLVHLS